MILESIISFAEDFGVRSLEELEGSHARRAFLSSLLGNSRAGRAADRQALQRQKSREAVTAAGRVSKGCTRNPCY